MSFRKILFFISFFVCSGLCGQELKIISEGPKRSFRGMSVVDDNVVWVSGSEGTVGRSLNGGKTWEWMKVPGYEKCDFRDIEAFSKNEAVIMAVAEPAYILKTTNGGKSWKKVYENASQGMFLDAMDFRDKKNGIVVGDPVGGHFFLAKTGNGGETWEEFGGFFSADSGEACFASSGTNIRMLGDTEFGIVTGGTSSRLLVGFLSNPPKGQKGPDGFPNTVHITATYPLFPAQQKSSAGANSLAAKDFDHLMVVGGDFTEADSTQNNCLYISDPQRNGIPPEVKPHGYRSCVEYLRNDTWICCGLNGVDISFDNGKHWKTVSSNSFHVCRKAKKGTAVYFIGNDGRIGKLGAIRP